MTGIMVKKFVIIMSCENGECVVYEEYDKRKYIQLLSKYIREFVEWLWVLLQPKVRSRAR